MEVRVIRKSFELIVVLMEIGQVCIKTKGREAGKMVAVLSKPKAGRVLVDGPKAKRKQCNVLHLFPVNEIIKVKEEESHEGVLKAMKALK
jgi:large subunit ribosomal protein L14e